MKRYYINRETGSRLVLNGNGDKAQAFEAALRRNGYVEVTRKEYHGRDAMRENELVTYETRRGQ